MREEVLHEADAPRLETLDGGWYTFEKLVIETDIHREMLLKIMNSVAKIP